MMRWTTDHLLHPRSPLHPRYVLDTLRMYEHASVEAPSEIGNKPRRDSRHSQKAHPLPLLPPISKNAIIASRTSNQPHCGGHNFVRSHFLDDCFSLLLSQGLRADAELERRRPGPSHKHCWRMVKAPCTDK